jgi:hypothetical protein
VKIVEARMIVQNEKGNIVYVTFNLPDDWEKRPFDYIAKACLQPALMTIKNKLEYMNEQKKDV